MSQVARPRGHENIATVLVDPAILADFEIDLMSHDFRVWVVATAPVFRDPARLAFQVRRNLIEWSQGRWADAADWTLVWVSFGESWQDGDEPLPWAAHEALWTKLDAYRGFVRFNKGLGGVPYLDVPPDVINRA